MLTATDEQAVDNFLMTVDHLVHEAVKEVIASEQWTLEDYLRELDLNRFEIECLHNVKVKFENHRAKVILDFSSNGTYYHWKFHQPITIEAGAIFEYFLD